MPGELHGPSNSASISIEIVLNVGLVCLGKSSINLGKTLRDSLPSYFDTYLYFFIIEVTHACCFLNIKPLRKI